MVLIDELDLHLHPAWQRRLPGVLKRAFPRVQFIAASHSPQMIGELPFDEIWLMRDNQALGHPEHALGLSSNQVLEQLMDSAPRNPRIDEALREIDQLIDADHIGDAQTSWTPWPMRWGRFPRWSARKAPSTLALAGGRPGVRSIDKGARTGRAERLEGAQRRHPRHLRYDGIGFPREAVRRALLLEQRHLCATPCKPCSPPNSASGAVGTPALPAISSTFAAGAPDCRQH